MAVLDFHVLVRDEGGFWVCNATNHYSNPILPDRVPTIRQATERDMAAGIDDVTTQFLDDLAGLVSDKEEFNRIAETLGVGADKLKAYMQVADPEDAPGSFEKAFDYFFACEMVAAAFELKCAVSDMAIIGATPEQLETWPEFFRADAADLYAKMVEIYATTKIDNLPDDDTAAGILKKIRRKASLYWQAQRRLGVW